MSICNLFTSRRNATFWSKVGKTGVDETGVGEQVPIRMQQYIHKIWMFWDENDKDGSQTQGTRYPGLSWRGSLAEHWQLCSISMTTAILLFSVFASQRLISSFPICDKSFISTTQYIWHWNSTTIYAMTESYRSIIIMSLPSWVNDCIFQVPVLHTYIEGTLTKRSWVHLYVSTHQEQ